jgi:hypothetical protein
MTDAPKVATGAAPDPLANMGRPEPRLDGRLKVTGQARYAADVAVPNAAHAFLVTSAIARGRIRGFDLAEAEAVPGVLHIMTHQNRGPLGAFKFFGQGGEASSGVPPLASDRIAHDGEIIGMVIADSYEAAREAAYRVRVAYEAEEPTATLESRGTETKAAAEASPEHEDPSLGDAAAALAALLRGDRCWEDPDRAEALRAPLTRLCAEYLTASNGGRGPRDPVARFHLGNGARLERVNWLGNTAPRGMRESFGVMVNYLYDLQSIEANHEAFVRSGTVARSAQVDALLAPPTAGGDGAFRRG